MKSIVSVSSISFANSRIHIKGEFKAGLIHGFDFKIGIEYCGMPICLKPPNVHTDIKAHAGRLAFSLESETDFRPPLDLVIFVQLNGVRHSVGEFSIGSESENIAPNASLATAKENIAPKAENPELPNIQKEFIGNMGLTHDNRLLGWVANKHDPDEILSIDFVIDGKLFSRQTASDFRIDLAQKGICNIGGGFQFPIPRYFGKSDGKHTLEVLISDSDQKLPNNKIEFTSLAEIQNGFALNDEIIAINREIAIIIPIYNAHDYVKACIESVIENTFCPARLILINDKSTDERIDKLLDSFTHFTNIHVFRNETNLGYTATVNRGIDAAGELDCVILNSDTLVGPNWLRNLQIKAYSAPKVATVTPMSNNAGAFSTPIYGGCAINELGMNFPDLARIVLQNGSLQRLEIPTGNGFCLYLRREAINSIGKFDAQSFPRGYGEENDFCCRAIDCGFSNQIDFKTLIAHEGSASFGIEKQKLLKSGREIIDEKFPEYGKSVSIFLHNDLFRNARFKLSEAIKEAQKGGNKIRPRALFVLSTKTGGTPQTNRDLMIGLQNQYDTYELYSDGINIELFHFDGKNSRSIFKHILTNEIRPATHVSTEYDEILTEMLLKFGFELLHIRHIAWHGLGLSRIAKNLKIPVFFSFHDFYSICPTVKLINENNEYCGGNCKSVSANCIAELWREDEMPILHDNFVHRWRKFFAKFLMNCDGFITTSQSTKDLIISKFEFLKSRDFQVIEHGRDFGEIAQLARSVVFGEKMRILVPGNISAAKGAEIIQKLAPLVADFAEFHIIGDSGKIIGGANIIIHGKYDRHDFAKLVNKIRPHIGAIFSMWPETYCHTLTECWSCGIPVFGFDIGAVGERIAKANAGWLINHDANPEEIAKKLRQIKSDEINYNKAVKHTIEWQDTHKNENSISVMAEKYFEFYQSVNAKFRAFN